MSSLLDAPKQYRTRAQCQPIPRNFNQTFLVNTDPVGKQAELHVMDDCLSLEFIPATIGHVGARGLRFLLCAPTEKIISERRFAGLQPLIALRVTGDVGLHGWRYG